MIHRTIIIALLIAAVPVSGTADAGITTDEELSNFLHYFYVSQNPGEAKEALRYLMQTKNFGKDIVKKQGELALSQQAILMVYYFSRIAELYPEVLRDYETLFDTADPKGRIFLLSVFMTCFDEANREFIRKSLSDFRSKEEMEVAHIILKATPIGTASYTEEIQGPLEIDCLWAEFFITGDDKPVRRVIGVLARPDIFRSRLEAWLRHASASEENREIAELLKKVLSVKVDLDTRKIDDAYDVIDLDINCIIMWQGPRMNREFIEYFGRLREAIGISDEDFYKLSTKGMAAWSLPRIAEYHERVWQICREELPTQPRKVQFFISTAVIPLENA
jgi:predicted acetyltransferase